MGDFWYSLSLNWDTNGLEYISTIEEGGRLCLSLKNNMLVLYYHVVTKLINIFGFFCLDLFLFVLSETTLRTIQL